MKGEESDSDIRQLISDWQAGDRNAFAKLYEKFAPRVTALLRRRFWDRTEDVVHDAFLKAFLKIDGFVLGEDRSKIEVQFLSWIVSIARNAGIDSLRRRRPITGIDLSQSAVETDLLEAIEVQEHQVILEACLDKLDETARALIAAQYGGDEDHATLCEKLRITAQRGYKLRHKAMEQLRECAKRTKR